MFQLLPVFYALGFFARHYFYKHIYPASWDKEVCITFLGCSAKSLFGSIDWYPSLQASCFMGNLLYLATLNKSLIVFNCAALPSGDYYMVDAPTVTCYEGDHLILMALACVTLVRVPLAVENIAVTFLLCQVVYTIGWPCFLCVAFRIADRKHLLNNPKFGVSLNLNLSPAVSAVFAVYSVFSFDSRSC